MRRYDDNWSPFDSKELIDKKADLVMVKDQTGDWVGERGRVLDSFKINYGRGSWFAWHQWSYDGRGGKFPPKAYATRKARPWDEKAMPVIRWNDRTIRFEYRDAPEGAGRGLIEKLVDLIRDFYRKI